MYELKYNDESEVKTLTASTEEEVIKKYNRLVCASPESYKVISITDTDKQADLDAYNSRKEEERKEVLKQVNSTIKAFLKTPYTSGNKRKEKSINAKSSVLEYIKKELEQYKVSEGYYLIDGKIEVGISYNIYITPTEQYYMSA
jgi:hypothetical protein